MQAARRSSSKGRVADVVARGLARSGVRLAFGHPGGELAVLLDALQGAGIRFVLTHHENTAAFMAGGYGELTGEPGVCLATLGPGATNMTTGVANALLDRAPMIAITASLAESAPQGFTHQKLDLNALYAPIAKASWTLRSRRPASITAAAIELAKAPRPGPVHLTLANDVARALSAPENQRALSGKRPLRPPRWTRRSLDRAIRLIDGSRRPALLVGLDAVHDDASRAVLRAARALGAPVAVTPKAKGVMPETDPLFLGVIEMAGDDVLIELLRDADLIITVGLDAVELDKAWRLTAPVIAVTRLPEPEPYVPTTIELAGPISETLAAIASVRRPGWPQDDIARRRASLLSYLRPEGSRLQPWQVVEITRRARPDSTIATSDVGAHKFLVGQLWRTPRARTFLQSNGLSAMGYGIPVAAVARLLDPKRPSVALIGDGGLGMYTGELETLRRAELDLTIVVFADGTLELIRRSQLRQRVAMEGTSFDNPDFRALSRAFGLHGHVVGTARQLERAVTRAAAVPGIHLIAAQISPEDYRL